ncbi:hypothetical protein MNV49_001072 [Pseudohyphozyma bogoriensis]|nr:hypothetical protein MNV49_001072 [Pseudohyphozyma bogoriensis]
MGVSGSIGELAGRRSAPPSGPWTPTPADIRLALRLITKATALPPELGLLILDYAEYWTVTQEGKSPSSWRVSAGPTGQKSCAVVLVMELEAETFRENLARKIRIVTNSRDQGFSSFPQHHGTREASSSWFELLVLRPWTEDSTYPKFVENFPNFTPDQDLAVVRAEPFIRNLHGVGQFNKAVSELVRGGEDGIVESMQAGDLLVVAAETRELLRRYPLIDEAWTTRLDSAVADLSHPRKARIAVIGAQESGTSALTTAALDNPLSSDREFSLALASRRLGDAPEAIVIKYADRTRTAPHEVAVPSAWLRENNVEIVEIVYGDEAPLPSSFNAVYASDAVVLLVSELLPLTSPHLRSLLLEHASKPRLFLVLDSPEPHDSIIKTLQAELAAILPDGVDGPHIVVVSTYLALEGLEALAPTDPTKEVSYEAFQHSYVGSGLPHLKDQLATSISSTSGSSTLSSLQLETASYTLDKALEMAEREGEKVDDVLFRASTDVAALSLVGEKEGEAALAEMGLTNGILKVPEGELKKGLEAVEYVLDTRLAWWKLPARSDDIVAEVAVIVDQAYLRNFEDQLIFSTGKVLGLSSRLDKRTDDLLSTPAFSSAAPSLSSLYSPILLNRIAQAATITRSITSNDLAYPLMRRRNQITSAGGPAEVLQSRAQGALVSAVSVGGGSIAAATASEVLGYAEMATNVGGGLFGVMVAVWGLQRGWEKAKRKFLRDIEGRVTGGLEDDLGAAAENLVERSTFKLRTAVAGAQELLRKRKGDSAAFKRALNVIEEKRDA